jgi:hypothetical protein
MSVDVVGSQQNPLGFLQMPVHYALKIELGTEEDNQSRMITDQSVGAKRLDFGS